MRRRRSETMRAIDTVMPLVDQFNLLDEEDQRIFLDMVDPLPDEVEQKPTKKPKKKSTKVGGKSARAQGLSEAIRQNVQRRTPGSETVDDLSDLTGGFAACSYQWPGSGLKCDAAADSNIHHLTSATGYHEFLAPEQAAGVSGD